MGYLTGAKSPQVSLSFSADQQFLLGGSTSGETTVWNLESGQSVSISGHTEGVYGAAFSPVARKMVTAAYDGRAILWDIEVLYDAEKKLDYRVLTHHTDRIRAVAYAPGGEYFATAGFDNRVLLYNGTTGELVKELIKITDEQYGEQHGFGDIHALDFSDDGKQLAIGTSLSNNENVWIVEVASGKKITGFTGHDNTVMALDFTDGKVVSAGGENRGIHVWEAATGRVLQSFAGLGKRVYAVGIDDRLRIAYGQTGYPGNARSFNHFGLPDRYMDLQTFTIGQTGDDSTAGFTSEVYSHEGYTLEGRSLSELVIIAPDGQETPIALDGGADGDLRCFTFTADGNVAVGTIYRIILFDRSGNRLRELNGHTADVYSMASRGRWLISGSADQTIRFWDLADEGDYTMSKDAFRKYLQHLGIDENGLQQLLEEKKLSFEELYLQFNTKTVRPAFTFLPVGDDWILYAADNYYATSRNGNRFVGFHFNQGPSKAASYSHFRQFDYQLNRPDRVVEKLFPGNEPLRQALAQAVDRRIKRSGYVVPQDNALSEAPVLTLKNIPQVVTDPKVKLSFDLRGTDLQKVNVTVNGVPVEVSGSDLARLFSPGTYSVLVYSCHFMLVNGRNEIDIWATGKNGVSSNVESFTLHCRQPEKKPDLYLVCLGVSRYKQQGFDLAYAAKDANDVSLLLATDGHSYGNVHRLLLTDEHVTANAVETIGAFLSASGINDRVVLFYAGHGMFDDRFDYYLASHETDFTLPAEKSISYRELERMLSGVPARSKLVLIDACHSGEVDREELAFAASPGNTTGQVKFRTGGAGAVQLKTGLGNGSFALMKELFADMNSLTGANIISSAGGLELAMESETWKNGLFTWCLLEGVKNKTADLDADGKLTVTELGQYLQGRVMALSAGKQVPTVRTQNPGADFIIR